MPLQAKTCCSSIKLFSVKTTKTETYIRSKSYIFGTQNFQLRSNSACHHFFGFLCVSHLAHIQTHKCTYRLTNQTKLKSILMILIWLKVLRNSCTVPYLFVPGIAEQSWRKFNLWFIKPSGLQSFNPCENQNGKTVPRRSVCELYNCKI